MSRAVRTDPKLWESVKRRLIKSTKAGGVGWNARKAQLAVLEYKRRGGMYKAGARLKTSLHKWTAEKWQYVDGNTKGRYLPKRVIESLTRAEKARENKKKRGEWVPYSASVAAKMRKAKIF